MMDCELSCKMLTEEVIKHNLTFKIIVIGFSGRVKLILGVGKSCLTMQATKNIFLPNYNSTIGFEFSNLNLKINDHIVNLQIWDTCGQEIYRSLVSNFYRNSSLAIIVYAIDK
jgi:GTPase SAR1 family protein